MSTNPTNAELDAQALEKQGKELQKESEELEKKKQQLESESKQIDEKITKEQEALETKTIFEGKKVLEQDKPQREEQEFTYKKKAYDKYNVEVEQFNEKTQKMVDEFNTKATGFGVEVEGFNVKISDYNKVVEQQKKEFEDYKIQFQKDYGITYEKYLVDEEKRKKAEETHQQKLKEYDDQIKTIEQQRDEALSEAHSQYWGHDRHTKPYKSRRQFNYEQSRRAKRYNDQIKNIQLDKQFYSQSYTAYQSGIPAYAITKYERMYRNSKADFKAALRAGKSISSQAAYYAKSKEAKSAAQAASSILSAQSTAIKASEQYAKDVTAYSSGIQKFDEKKVADPFIMQNPSAEFLERVGGIQPLKVSAGTGGYIPQLTKSANRPLLTGVRFEVVEQKKIETIQQKQTVRAMSPREISKSISMGMMPNQAIGDIGISFDELIKKQGGEFTKPMPQPKETVRAMSPREVSKSISEGKIPNQMIGNIQSPDAAMQSMLSGEYTKPYPTKTTIEKPLSLTGSAAQTGLELIEKRLQQRPKTLAGQVLDWRFGIELGVAKDALSTYAFLENLYQKAKTINFRKEAPPPDSLSLKDLGKNFLARVQFDEQTRGDIEIPDTLFTTVSEPAFEKDFTSIPFKVKAYSEKYGIPATLGEAGFILWGTGIEKGVESLAGVGKTVATKVSQKIKPPLATITQEGKIYPNIAKQRELYITQLEASKPSQSITAQLVKSKYEWKKPIDIKVKISYETPTPKTAVPVDWSVQEAKIKLPSQSKPPIKSQDLVGSVSRPTPKTGTAPLISKPVGTLTPSKIAIPKGVDVPKVISTGKPPVNIDWAVKETKVTMKPRSLPPIKTQELTGSTFRITPQTGISPLFTRLGTYKPIKSTIPKGVDVPKVISTGKPPIPIQYVPERTLLGKITSGKPPIQTQPLVGSTLRPLPPTGSRPIYEKIGTYKSPKIDIPKGITVPKVVSTGRPPVSIDWSVTEKSFRGLSKGRPIKQLTYQTTFRATPKTGTAPSLQALIPKIVSPVQRDPLFVRFKGKVTLPKGFTPIEESKQFMAAKIKIQRQMPKGFGTSSKPPISTDFARWEIPAKLPKTGTAPIKKTPRYIIDEPPKLPKVGGQPSLQVWTPKQTISPVQRDPLFVRFKGKVTLPKGVEPSTFKETKIGLGETKTTTAPIMRISNAPIKKKFEPKTPKKLAKELEKDIAKPSSEMPIVSKSGVITIQKTKIVTPKQIQRTAVISPTPTKTLTKGTAPKIPKTGTAPALFVPKYIEKKKQPQPQAEYKVQDYDQVTDYAISNKIKTEPSLSYNVKPSQTPKTLIENKPIVTTKSIITPVTVYKPIQQSKPVEIIKTQQVERSILREKARQRQTQRIAVGQPPKAPQAPRQLAAQPQKQRVREIARLRTPPPPKNKIIRSAIIPPPPPDRKPKEKKSKASKTKDFIGNVQLTRIEGMYKRATLIYGKRVKKLEKKDIEKEFIRQKRTRVKSLFSKPSKVNIITGKKQSKPKKSGNKLKRFLNF